MRRMNYRSRTVAHKDGGHGGERGAGEGVHVPAWLAAAFLGSRRSEQRCGGAIAGSAVVDMRHGRWYGVVWWIARSDSSEAIYEV